MDALIVICTAASATALMISLMNRYTVERINRQLAKQDKHAANLENRHRGLAAQVLDTADGDAIELVRQRVATLEEAQRLAGRKKNRRRNPQTGRYESFYVDEPAT